MKKTMFRFLVFGLFAVVSLNASAEMNYMYIKYCVGDKYYFSEKVGDFYVSWSWMEPYTCIDYEIDAFPNDNENSTHTGELVRVAWGPSFNLSGLQEGDVLGVYGMGDTGACISWQGTNSVYETVVEVNSDGKFWFHVCAGSTAGVRTFGPLFYWWRNFEDFECGAREQINWNLVWGWGAWSWPYPTPIWPN
jgi:hypothetical protein